MQVKEEEEDGKAKLAAIAEEVEGLEGELEELESRQHEGAASLARHCDDIDMKIAATKRDFLQSRDARRELQGFADDIRAEQKRRQLQLVGARADADEDEESQLQEELEELEMQQLQLQIELDDVEKKRKADEVLLNRYKEHKSELQARVARGGAAVVAPCFAFFVIKYLTKFQKDCMM